MRLLILCGIMNSTWGRPRRDLDLAVLEVKQYCGRKKFILFTNDFVFRGSEKWLNALKNGSPRVLPSTTAAGIITALHVATRRHRKEDWGLTRDSEKEKCACISLWSYSLANSSRVIIRANGHWRGANPILRSSRLGSNREWTGTKQTRKRKTRSIISLMGNKKRSEKKS